MDCIGTDAAMASTSDSKRQCKWLDAIESEQVSATFTAKQQSARSGKAKRGSFRVNKRHFRPTDFEWRERKGKAPELRLTSTAVPSLELQMSRTELDELMGRDPPDGWASPPRKVLPGAVACPCHAGSRCNTNIRTGGVLTPKDPAGRSAWAKLLMPRGSPEELAAFCNQRTHAAAHFRADQLFANGRVKPNQLPMQKPPVPEPPAGAIDPRSAEGRRLGTEVVRLASAIQAGETAELGFHQLVSEVAAMYPVEEPPLPPTNAATDQKDWIIAKMKTSPAACRYYTGEVNWECVVANWDFMDVDGAFSAMGTALHASSAGVGVARKRNRRPPAIPPFEQYVFWLTVFKRFKECLPHCASLFGISEATGYRYYETWTVAVMNLSRCTMPAPTYEQYLADTPVKTRDLLELGPHEAVEVGDATERYMNDTQNRPLHSANHSSYKSHQTIKLNVMTTGSSYITHVDQWCCGAITDNAQHDLFDVAQRQSAVVAAGIAAGNPDAAMAYNYDRGISDLDPFRRKGIRVVQAEKKRDRQMVFSAASAVLSRATAKSRIHVERGMQELKSYAGFKSVVRMRHVDLADAEAECARFLVNLKPRLHNWTDASLHADAGNTGLGQPDCSGITGDLACLY